MGHLEAIYVTLIARHLEIIFFFAILFLYLSFTPKSIEIFLL